MTGAPDAFRLAFSDELFPPITLPKERAAGFADSVPCGAESPPLPGASPWQAVNAATSGSQEIFVAQLRRPQKIVNTTNLYATVGTPRRGDNWLHSPKANYAVVWVFCAPKRKTSRRGRATYTIVWGRKVEKRQYSRGGNVKIFSHVSPWRARRFTPGAPVREVGGWFASL